MLIPLRPVQFQKEFQEELKPLKREPDLIHLIVNLQLKVLEELSSNWDNWDPEYQLKDLVSDFNLHKGSLKDIVNKLIYDLSQIFYCSKISEIKIRLMSLDSKFYNTLKHTLYYLEGIYLEKRPQDQYYFWVTWDLFFETDQMRKPDMKPSSLIINRIFRTKLKDDTSLE